MRSLQFPRAEAKCIRMSCVLHRPAAWSEASVYLAAMGPLTLMGTLSMNITFLFSLNTSLILTLMLCNFNIKGYEGFNKALEGSITLNCDGGYKDEIAVIGGVLCDYEEDFQ